MPDSISPMNQNGRCRRLYPAEGTRHAADSILFLPNAALLRADRNRGAYTDCYFADVDGAITHERFVVTFYTTCLFKLERWVLAWAVSRPSTDAEARQLVAGSLDTFAAWRMERRAIDQLLMVDLNGSTKSWLMVQPLVVSDRPTRRLYFGSVVVAQRASGNGRMPWKFRMLLGFHKLYSVLLLRAARSTLARCA